MCKFVNLHEYIYIYMCIYIDIDMSVCVYVCAHASRDKQVWQHMSNGCCLRLLQKFFLSVVHIIHICSKSAGPEEQEQVLSKEHLGKDGQAGV